MDRATCEGYGFGITYRIAVLTERYEAAEVVSPPHGHCLPGQILDSRLAGPVEESG
jgi:hypothetical protein